MHKKSTQFKTPVFLGASVRSPIGKFGGSLAPLSAPELAALTLKECLQRANHSSPDWVLMGHARQAGCGPNPARQATLGAGISDSIPAITVNQACASGMTAIMGAVEKIQSGQATSIYAGGVESMSNTPYLLPQARFGYRLGHQKVLDGMRKDGFFCPMSQLLMGETVEQFIARPQNISRDTQDQFAQTSQERAAAAWKSGHFKNETFAIAVKDGKPFQEDEHRREGSTLVSLAKLPPVFDPKLGTLTAGNSSGITDGAAFMHVTKTRTDSTQAEVLDFQTVALDPKLMGLGPISAIQKLLDRNSLKISDLASIEINEAFAAQAIACQTALKIPNELLNPHGGAIALGHPIGASGARVTVTLIHTLLSKGQDALGIASLCVSGGMGVAILIRTVR